MVSIPSASRGLICRFSYFLVSTNQSNLVSIKCRKFSPGEKLANGYCLKQSVPSSLPGVAWLASDPDLQTEVVLHFLPDSVVSDAEAIEELKEEVHRNRQMVHPRIVRLHALVEGEGWVALVMDFTGGQTLRQLLENKKFFECRELKEWLGQICSVVEDAHQADLLHGDLSLENLWVTPSGNLALANFGVSRVIGNSLKGAAHSDKQDRPGHPKATKADDIYSIGLLLYELLTGMAPIPEGETEISKGTFAPVSVCRKELGIKGERIFPEWEKTIALCLEKNPHLRPKSAIEIAMRLGEQRPLPSSSMGTNGGVTTNSKRSVPFGRPAIRSTVRPGERPGYESFEIGSAGGQPPEEDSSELEKKPKNVSRKSKPKGPQYSTNVFMPVGRPLGPSGETKKGGPVLLLVLLLLLGGAAVGAFFLLFGKHQFSKPLVPISESKEVVQKEATPEPEKIEPAPSAAPVQTPEQTPSSDLAAAPTPTPVPAVPKVKIMLEPARIPEEETALFKSARKSPSALEEAKNALGANQKARQEKLQLQEKAISELKEAQAAAEKANAEMLLKQAAAAEVAKTLESLATEADKKTQAIKDAEADKARFQAVFSQIAALKKERAAETEVAATEEIAGLKNPDQFVDDMAEPVEAPASVVAEGAGAGPSVEVGGAAKVLSNTLGMQFVTVGDVKFSVWLTRVQDFEAFATATGLKSTAWKHPSFAQGPTHPVVNVSWKDANAFCHWLTLKERKEGRLSSEQVYRLPTDAEWSVAVGLSYEKGRSAQNRDMDVPGVYPWGTQWPPPEGAGNFTGEETGSDAVIKGYNDRYAWTSPVGAFPPNQFGLYDMAGNAWQWCMDYWNEEKKARTLRGSAWCNSALNLSLLSSCRFHAVPESIAEYYSFRCVIAPKPEGYF